MARIICTNNKERVYQMSIIEKQKLVKCAVRRKNLLETLKCSLFPRKNENFAPKINWRVENNKKHSCRTVLKLEFEQRATTKNMMYRQRFIKKSAFSELKTWLLINVKHAPINHH